MSIDQLQNYHGTVIMIVAAGISWQKIPLEREAKKNLAIVAHKKKAHAETTRAFWKKRS